MKFKPLQYQTVKPILRTTLERLMSIDEFSPFSLVGGTSLSLRYGHRMSDDIDLFTDAQYGTIDFHPLQNILRKKFAYCQGECGDNVSFGASYMIGNSQNDCVKLDLYYTDNFIKPITTIESIRIASIEDIIAMKMDVISRGGRKKDFWDLHLLHNKFSISQMLALYEKRYPYGASTEECIIGLTNFNIADNDPDPICLQHKMWQLIKLDFVDWAANYSK